MRLLGLFVLSMLPVTAQTALPADEQSKARPAVAVEAPYRLEPGDEIEIRFVMHSEYNERGHIRPDGRFSVPGIGEVSAAGLTIQDLTSQLKTRYAFLRDPDPSVQVCGYGNRKVFVGGEVARPGPVFMSGPKTVAEALVECGGLKETAYRKAVVLIRRGANGEPVTYRVPMYGNGKALDVAATRLEPYDVVVATESRISKVDRAVDQYIRRLIPGLLTAGFSYLGGATTTYVPR